MHGCGAKNKPLLIPSLADGAWMRLRSAKGGLLPNPRRVSLGVREVPPSPDTSHNLLLMQLGQFVDHDLSVVPTLKGEGRGMPPQVQVYDMIKLFIFWK